MSFFTMPKRNISGLKKISLFKTKKIGGVGLTYLDKAYFEVRRKHLENLPANETLSEEELDKIINFEQKKAEKDFTFFTTNSELHRSYIEEIKNLYSYEFYTDVEEFGGFADLSYINDLQEAFVMKDDKKLDRESRIGIYEKSALYEACKENFLLPFEKDGKKIMGCLYATRDLNDFEFDEIAFLSSDIFEEFAPYTIQDFGFLEGKSLKNSTGEEIVATMLERMLNDGYSDISLFRFNRNHYAVMATKHGQYEYLTTKMPIELARVITFALLKRMGTDKSNKDNYIKRKMDLDVGGIKRSFRANMIKQSKSEIKGEMFDRSISIRALSDISMIANLENIGYPVEIIEILQYCILNNLSIAWTGETNSGKTTQLYTCALKAYKSGDKPIKIMTVSSPREYDIDGFIQFDMDESKDSSKPMEYDSLIENILQQNPKYIILDELKAQVDFKFFIQQVLNRGHTGYTTFHTGSNRGAIQLLSENSGFKISSFIKNLPVWINTDLLPRRCQVCDGSGIIESANEKCAKCKGKGYFGVIPAIEFTYFTTKFDAKRDDALDFETLEKEGKIIWFKKSKAVETLYNNKLIRKEDYELLSGKTEEQLVELLRDFSKKEHYTYNKDF